MPLLVKAVYCELTIITWNKFGWKRNLFLHIPVETHFPVTHHCLGILFSCSCQAVPSSGRLDHLYNNPVYPHLLPLASHSHQHHSLHRHLYHYGILCRCLRRYIHVLGYLRCIHFWVYLPDIPCKIHRIRFDGCTCSYAYGSLLLYQHHTHCSWNIKCGTIIRGRDVCLVEPSKRNMFSRDPSYIHRIPKVLSRNANSFPFWLYTLGNSYMCTSYSFLSGIWD